MGDNKKVKIGFRFQVLGFKRLVSRFKFHVSGLTLIELLVSMTMLGLTMIAVVSIFVSTIEGQNRSLASQQLMNQTSYSLEYMSRAIRMAKKDNGTGDCTGTGTAYLNYVKTESGNGIRFLSYRDKCYEFRLNTGTGRLQERKSTDHTSASFGSWTDITSDQIEVLSFNIGPDASWDQNDSEQPRVTLYFDIRGKAAALETKDQPRIKIQTMVSQRNLDCYE